MESRTSLRIFDPSANNPFAQPNGLLGGLAGRFMLWSNKQDDVIEVLDVQPGDHVLEVGFGPGGLIRLIADRTEAASIRGIDPSAEMRRLAARLNRQAVRSGRVQLDLGTAERTGLRDASVDRAVSVNNVAIWPDLDAAIRELHRVIRPDGMVVIAWHGGRSPSRIARRLRLPEQKLRLIEERLRERFTDVARHRLHSLDVLSAVRLR